MSLRKILGLTFLFCIAIAIGINLDKRDTIQVEDIKIEEEKYDGPEQFALYHRGIRTKEGDTEPGYPLGNGVIELQKAKAKATVYRSTFRTQSNGVLEWKERGPANVAGRTRGLIVDPDDPTRNTWFVGSASGGVWKTTNAGAIWQPITPDLPNLATTVLAMAPSNSSIIYLGTGEGFFNVGGVNGNGMYKSVDKGQTWSHLPTTTTFDDINRAIVHPTNPDIVVVASNNGIYRTVNGGTSWTKVYSESGRIQDLKMTPGNFDIQYATRNSFGVLKSVDGGISWNTSSVGMDPDGRIEIDVSPVKPNRIFAAVQGSASGVDSDLYTSDDAGASWLLINTSINQGQPVDFLGTQGWYDNTILCDPFDENIIYFGGIGLYQLKLDGGSTTVKTYGFNENNTSSFLELRSFTGGTHYDGRVSVEENANMSIEIRFGPGVSQKAHRFFVPIDKTSGVPANEYTYQDYVTVPFEVWDVSNNLQLMVSFRDQDRNGDFNLKVFDAGETTPPTEQTREYMFIHNIPYNQTNAHPLIAVAGGHEFSDAYFIWPALAPNGAWDPANLPASSFDISLFRKLSATTKTSVDINSAFDGKNSWTPSTGTGVHPDQHNMVAIPINAAQKTYKILLANDGGVYESNVSTTPGTIQGSWRYTGFGYNTSQFYGVDKKPGADHYFGGTQDNGTWRSSGIPANSTTNYLFAIGGDGFEVLWHNLDPDKLIGGSQYNNFRRSTNGGSTWVGATTGITGSKPFISKLANSKNYPDRIFTVTSDGVFRSEDFGLNWTLVPITSFWGTSTSFMDVEVSRANANIVWAGSGMNSTRKLHVSTDGGKTFTPTVNYASMGSFSKIASHPTEPNTAYALFSFADNPKILRTTDLGQTWEDLSGFGNNDESSNGFPDVAVYSLYVRPDNTDIIWAGTEIGIFESLDNGQSWLLIEGFPSVSVWEMKGQDDQVVIATHGRGIWTATIDQSQLTIKSPELITHGTSPKEKFVAKVLIETQYDSMEILFNNTSSGISKNLTPGEYIFQISGLPPNTYELVFKTYTGSAPTLSKTYSVEQLDILSIEDSYAYYFNNSSEITLRNMTLRNFTGSAERMSAQTTHNYTNNNSYQTILRHPLKVNSTFPTLYVSDLALTEPGKDTVTIEATKDGITWIPINSGYDASAHDEWLAAFNTASGGSSQLFRESNYDISQKFADGDTLLFRLQLKTNHTGVGWGWAINYVTMQLEPLAINTETSSDFRLFPNPASDKITLEYSLSRPSDVQYQLVNNNGQSILQRDLGLKGIGKQVEDIPLSNQPVGSYVLILKTNGERKAVRFIIQR